MVGKNSNSNLLSTVNVKSFLDRVRSYHLVTFRRAISKDARNIFLPNLTEYRLLSFIRAFEVTRIRHSFWLVANCHDWSLVISGTNQNNRCSWTHASGCRYLSTKRPNKIYDDINVEKVQVSGSDWDRVRSLAEKFRALVKIDLEIASIPGDNNEFRTRRPSTNMLKVSNEFPAYRDIDRCRISTKKLWNWFFGKLKIAKGISNKEGYVIVRIYFF